MRAWIPVVLTVPFALGGCPALLGDWTINGSGAVDASVDDAAPEAARSSSGSRNGGSSGRGGGSMSGGSGASGGVVGTGGALNTGGISETGGTGTGATSTGGATNTGGTASTGGTTSAAGTTSAGGKAGSGPVCESLQGPTGLSPTNAGAIGITFHSKANATLVKFVFHNGGYADTVSLQDGVSCSVIGSVPIPANIQSYAANVSWPLVANKSYRLVSSVVNAGSGYNQTQAITPNWPWTNGQNLVVDDCAGGVDHCSSTGSSLACGWSHQYWFNFTDLEICE